MTKLLTKKLKLFLLFTQGPAQLGINFDEGKTLKNQYYELLNVLILSQYDFMCKSFSSFLWLLTRHQGS